MDSASALLRHTDGGVVSSGALASGTPRRGVGATAGDLVALQQQQRHSQTGGAGAGNSFAAGAVEDDNLVDQLAAAGRRPVSAVAVV